MTTLKRVGLIFAAAFIVMQFIRFEKTNPIGKPENELKAESRKRKARKGAESRKLENELKA